MKRTHLKFLSWLGLISSLLIAMARIAETQGNQVLRLEIEAMAWSPDGNKIAVGGGEYGCDAEILASHNVFILDAFNGNILQTLSGSSCNIKYIAWNSDGSQIATSDLENTRIWDPFTGNQLMMSSARSLGEITWSPDNTQIGSPWVEDRMSVIWDVMTGQTIHVLGLSPEFDFNKSLSVAWDPRGNMLVSGGILSFTEPDGFIRFWDVGNGNLIKDLEHPDGVSSLAWKPDGTLLASGSGNSEIRLWDPNTFELVQTLHGDGGKLKWHPFESLIAGGSTGDNSTITVWNTTTGEVIQTFETDVWTPTVEWSPFGGRLLYNTQNEITLDNQQRVNLSEALQFSVPDPSLSRLSGVASLCLSRSSTTISTQATDLISESQVKTLTTSSLPDFITQIKALPADAIPTACQADLIAVAEAIIAQE